MEIVAVLRGFFKPVFRNFPPGDFSGAGNIGCAADIRVIEMTTRSAHQERAIAMKAEYKACSTCEIVTAYFAPGATNVCSLLNETDPELVKMQLDLYWFRFYVRSSYKFLSVK